MEEDNTEVRIRIGKKIVKILRGEEAEMALKAIQYVLDAVKNHKKLKIDIVDVEIPKNFSYAKSLIEALNKGFTNPIEIADYILKQLEKTKNTS